jgi:hypothetical protein
MTLIPASAPSAPGALELGRTPRSVGRKTKYAERNYQKSYLTRTYVYIYININIIYVYKLL